jgi:PRC-barrel domain
VTHLVIEKGLVFATNKIVPIDRVNPDDEERIVLTSLENDLGEFEDFEEAHFVNLDSADSPGSDVTTSFWYPPVDYAWWTGLPALAPPMPVYTVKSTQNIPAGTVALEEGAKVTSADDKHIGSIEQLIVDSQDNRVTHFVIKEGILLKERKLIPVTWI